jgi:hypothetical protein
MQIGTTSKPIRGKSVTHVSGMNPYAYRLADLGRLCRDCVDLMAHFDRVLPGRGRLRMAYFSNVSKYISCT